MYRVCVYTVTCVSELTVRTSLYVSLASVTVAVNAKFLLSESEPENEFFFFCESVKSTIAIQFSNCLPLSKRSFESYTIIRGLLMCD